jgi:organic hydroperoxide reductase OsmC/OhrA
MTDEALSLSLELTQVDDYEFRVRFDWPNVPELTLDEPEPLGRAAGPNAARLVAAAVGNCLSSSLLFCMKKFKQAPGTLHSEVRGTLLRNAHGRLRIGRFDVTIHLADPIGAIQHLDRCIEQFEDFCIVTESVRAGIPVDVRVVDSEDREVYSTTRPVPAPIGAGSA